MMAAAVRTKPTFEVTGRSRLLRRPKPRRPLHPPRRPSWRRALRTHGSDSLRGQPASFDHRL